MLVIEEHQIPEDGWTPDILIDKTSTSLREMRGLCYAVAIIWEHARHEQLDKDPKKAWKLNSSMIMRDALTWWCHFSQQLWNIFRMTLHRWWLETSAVQKWKLYLQHSRSTDPKGSSPLPLLKLCRQIWIQPRFLVWCEENLGRSMVGVLQ
jgi:hypothetical protein